MTPLRGGTLTELTDQRAEVMGILKPYGALQEMTKLQERYVALQGHLDRVETRLCEMKKLKDTKRNVKTAEQDHKQRRDVWSTAVKLFNEHSQSLYRSPGKLVIDVSDTGYKYSVGRLRSYVSNDWKSGQMPGVAGQDFG